MGATFDFVVYRTAEEEISVNAIVKDETIWLTQAAMARLFDVNTQAISKHLANIYETGELLEEATCSKMEQVAPNGRKYQYKFYNLDAIISVGYRVNSAHAPRHIGLVAGAAAGGGLGGLRPRWEPCTCAERAHV